MLIGKPEHQIRNAGITLKTEESALLQKMNHYQSNAYQIMGVEPVLAVSEKEAGCIRVHSHLCAI